MTTTMRAAAVSSPALASDAPRVGLSARVGNRDFSVSLEGRPVSLIGSRRDCQLPIEHADVSKVHCAIVNTGRAVYVVDLQSRTGTHIENQAVRCRLLRSGDQIRIAGFQIQVEITGAVDEGANTPPAHRLALEGAQIYELTNVAAVVGRRAQCDVHIDDPDVSLAHAIIFRVADHPVVFDLGSRSGTFVNDQHVSLAWLADGDALRIAGNTVRVHWDGPPPAPADSAVSAGDASAGDPSLAPPGNEGIEAELEDIEQTIAVLQTAVSTSRRRIDEQSDYLKRREREIESLRGEIAQRTGEFDEREKAIAEEEKDLADRGAFLEERWKELEGQRATLVESEAAIQVRQAELEKRESAVAETEKSQSELSELIEQERSDLEAARTALAAEQAAFASGKAEVEAARSEIEAARQQVASDRAALDGERQKAEQSRAELERIFGEQRAAGEALALRETALASRETALSEREQDVAKRTADMDRREEELEAEREEQADLSRKLARAKEALRSAANLITHSAEIEAEEAGFALATAPAARTEPAASVASAPPTHAPRTEADTEKPAGEQTGKAAPSPRSDSPALDRSGRPIPVVSKASASAEKAAAAAAAVDSKPTTPADVQRMSPEQQERFRVLRRLSGKSDAELIQQITAEGRARPSAADAASKKAKRGWWS